MAFSYNGWYADPSLSNCTMFRIPGTERTVLLHEGAAGELLVWAAAYWDQNIEPIDAGQLDDWGAVYRLVREGLALSNHSSGTALDINALRYPRGTSNMTLEKIKKVRAMVRKINDAAGARVIAWGGEWSGEFKDQMHLEIAEGATQAEVKRALDNLKTKQKIGFARTQWAFDGHPDGAPIYVGRVQQRLKDRGFLTGFYVPGYAGGKTKKALAAFCEKHGYIADGQVRRPALERLAAPTYDVVD